MSAPASSSSTTAPDDVEVCETGLSFGRIQLMLGIAAAVGFLVLMFGIWVQSSVSPAAIAVGSSKQQVKLVADWPLVDLSSTSKKKQWSPPNLDGGVHEINPGHKEDRFTLQPGQWAKLHAAGGMKYEIDAPDNFGYRLRLEDGTELKGGSRWDSSAHPTFYVEGARENQRFVFRETKK